MVYRYGVHCWIGDGSDKSDDCATIRPRTIGLSDDSDQIAFGWTVLDFCRAFVVRQLFNTADRLAKDLIDLIVIEINIVKWDAKNRAILSKWIHELVRHSHYVSISVLLWGENNTVAHHTELTSPPASRPNDFKSQS